MSPQGRGHWSTELNDTSQEAHIINSDSLHLLVKITWLPTRTWPQRGCHCQITHTWNFWWLCFSLNINKSTLSFSIHLCTWWMWLMCIGVWETMTRTLSVPRHLPWSTLGTPHRLASRAKVFLLLSAWRSRGGSQSVCLTGLMCQGVTLSIEWPSMKQVLVDKYSNFLNPQ